MKKLTRTKSPPIAFAAKVGAKKKALTTKLATPAEGQLGRSGLSMLFSYLGGGNERLTFNPSRIPLRIYDMMRNSPTVAAALSMVKEPIIGVDWRIKCEDEKRATFVESVLRPLWPSFIRDVMMGMDFGYTPVEKVWTYDRADGMVKYQKLVAMDPTTIEILIDEVGNFTGVAQLQNGKRQVISGDKIFLYTHKKEYGNFYGRSRQRGAYAPWLYREYILQFAGTFYEKYGMPLLVGYAPPGIAQFKGTQVDNVEHMQRLLDSAQAASSLTLPWTKDDKWKIDTLESKRTGGDYIQMLEYLDKKIWEGIMVPELTMKGGDKGSYALFEEQASLFAQSTDATITELKQYIDQDLIPQLIEYNFGAGGPPCEFVFYPLSARNKNLVGTVMQALIQNGNPQLPLRWLQEQFRSIGYESGLDELIDEVIPNLPVNVPAKTKVEGGTTLQRRGRRRPVQLGRRALFPWEQKVKFDTIKTRFDEMQAELLNKLQAWVDKQRDAFADQVAAIMASSPNPSKEISELELSYAQEYSDVLNQYIKELFQAGKADVEDEMDLETITVPLAATQWLNAQADVLAEKHQQDMLYAAQQAALSAVSMDVSPRQVVKEVRTAFDEYADEKLPSSASTLVHKTYEEGRDWTAEKAGLEFATWSAVLDAKTCPYCESQDGMTLRVDDPDFSRYSPGNVHDGCRCIWVFTTEEPAGAKPWEPPTKNQEDQFYQ